MSSERTGDTPEIEFLYFGGCPNSKQTLTNLRAVLAEIGLKTEPKVIDVNPDSFGRPFLGSPSIVVNGIDLYSSARPESFDFACRTFDIEGNRTGILPKWYIRDKIRQVLEASA